VRDLAIGSLESNLVRRHHAINDAEQQAVVAAFAFYA